MLRFMERNFSVCDISGFRRVIDENCAQRVVVIAYRHFEAVCR